MSESPLDWMALANRKAKGKRPDYFDNGQDELMLSMLMALVGEVSVVRERLDTVERLLDSQGCIERSDIEAFVPDQEQALERGMLTREFIFRVMRGPHQAAEALKENEPALSEVSKELRDI
ncbi:hypothetical protein [Sphingorhabdus sp. 109]|jgi:hypothetical protein|uniref:hypothetical protein n=1 Tax=Sphingorhabdus sp. 109 TaxID=2653173 RepID=UPI0012F345F2|nr:hypothetical protein [Sphingorhabdus sp. 109]VWX60693.1 conserved hypothetical protein [Sphingorhabdus sp. 109]